MKKVLLGLFALSAMAMAASNPGDKIDVDAKVGVQMEVKVEILPADERLVLVDETGRLIDKLVFDHGRFTQGGATTDSAIRKTVRLMKANKQPFGQEYKVQFEAKQGGNVVKETVPFALNGIGGASGETINSKLKYREDKIPVKDSDTEVSTPVISTIEASALNGVQSDKVGVYIGNGTFEATLKNN